MMARRTLKVSFFFLFFFFPLLAPLISGSGSTPSNTVPGVPFQAHPPRFHYPSSDNQMADAPAFQLDVCLKKKMNERKKEEELKPLSKAHSFIRGSSMLNTYSGRRRRKNRRRNRRKNRRKKKGKPVGGESIEKRKEKKKGEKGMSQVLEVQ